MRLNINAGGLAGFFNGVCSFLSEGVNEANSNHLINSFSNIINKTNNLNGGVGALSIGLGYVQKRKEAEVSWKIAMENVKSKTDSFIQIALRVDADVATMVCNSREEFYQTNPWLRPQTPSSNWDNILEKIWDTAGDTISKCWDGIIEFYSSNIGNKNEEFSMKEETVLIELEERYGKENANILHELVNTLKVKEKKGLWEYIQQVLVNGVANFQDIMGAIITYVLTIVKENKGIDVATLTDWGWNSKDFQDNPEAFVEHLNQVLERYEITNQDSIIIFLATMGHESGMGSSTTEQDYGDVNYWNDKNYGYEGRGAGYIQVTWLEKQKEFLMSEPINMKAEEIDKIEDLPSYIGDNYALEASAWYWTEVDQTRKGNLNAYVEEYGSGENIYLITQYYVNVWLTKNSTFNYDMEYLRNGGEFTYENEKTKENIVVNGHTYPTPTNWSDRKDKYEKILNLGKGENE